MQTKTETMRSGKKGKRTRTTFGVCRVNMKKSQQAYISTKYALDR